MTDTEQDTSEDVVVVRRTDLHHVLEVFINNGMVEAEDEDIVNRLWKIVVKDLTS